ncbi:P-loop containing nucleoside triphosphate hydrolase protein [Coemansia reversa NRRL 1564]|uniref:P-loop containing nucleoside triphosphate hydrolase protein n=1 Tax=Coemansia reversa (strain ATCC 12441 / NRRL 1564) TaxID=763665 RepID=A0A2G5B786_COERN|nr:P-loop containing nucleoside triphosphate hydrolase protein [Coemansia reversa NRRL 1564]|eukprot:PIA14860.1 P-loop containing nucleoside triphosphate hydrolase protein [Coemansia reversa NRRL 1564]
MSRNKRSNQICVSSEDDVAKEDDDVFLNEAFGFFARRAHRRQLSPPQIETTSKYFGCKRQRLQPGAEQTSRMPTPCQTLLSISQTTQPIVSPLLRPSQVNPESTSGMVPVSALPPEFATAYSFSHFNKLQSACFADLFATNANLVVSAPTASGKTVLMEIALCRLFQSHASRKCYKALYLAPLKALCAEKAADWGARFRLAGLHCAEATSDNDLGADVDVSRLTHMLQEAQIVCATPEKWMSLIRGSDSNLSILNTIELVLIDECHMVGTSRGAFLELSVSAIRMQNRQARIIAVSATIGNIGDISQWLCIYNNRGPEPHTTPAKTLIFGDEYRPVPLSKIVLGFECKAAYYKFQRSFDYKLPGIINSHCSGQQVLVFCSTRGSAQDLCRFLTHNIGQLVHRPAPIHLTAAFTNQLLNGSVPLGIAFHHSGLSAEDRSRIEQLFSSRSVKILCSTSTLGVGINLPASTVIIKGTKGYTDSGYEEYLSSEVLQFIGRAGRPQFGANGKAIILTETSQVGFYRSLVTGQDILESSLLAQVPRAIMHGIYKCDFLTINDAAKWLQFSFLAVRINKNPAIYGISVKHSNTDAESLCKDIVSKELHCLCQAGMISFTNHVYNTTALGECVAKHNVDPIPMADILANLPQSPSYYQVDKKAC